MVLKLCFLQVFSNTNNSNNQVMPQSLKRESKLSLFLADGLRLLFAGSLQLGNQPDQSVFKLQGRETPPSGLQVRDRNSTFRSSSKGKKLHLHSLGEGHSPPSTRLLSPALPWTPLPPCGPHGLVGSPGDLSTGPFQAGGLEPVSSSTLLSAAHLSLPLLRHLQPITS